MTTIFVVAGVTHFTLAAAQEDRAGLLDEGYNVEIECYDHAPEWTPCVTAIGTDHDGVEFD